MWATAKRRIPIQKSLAPLDKVATKKITEAMQAQGGYTAKTEDRLDPPRLPDNSDSEETPQSPKAAS